MRVLLHVLLPITGIFMLVGCGDPVALNTAGLPRRSLEESLPALRELETLDYAPVSEAARADRPAFQVETRSGAMTSFPCSSCHKASQVISAGDEILTRNMHVDIAMAHAPADKMSCATCHDPNNLDRLSGDLSFDRVYDLCSTCHFEQARDWAGGAHGKRLAGWSGDRVIKNCTGCHDPHAPQFEPRWPAATPSIPRLGDRSL